MRQVTILSRTDNKALLMVQDIGQVCLSKHDHDYPKAFKHGDIDLPDRPWHLVTFGQYAESVEACVELLRRLPKEKKTVMSECAYAYSMSCCNGSVYAN